MLRRGKFIRSESGRVASLQNSDGTFFINIPLCTRKDLRNAVEVAAKAAAGWANRSPYNRTQILYRLAEMLESRSAEMRDALTIGGASHKAAEQEVSATVERIVHFAGWADKYEQILGRQNLRQGLGACPYRDHRGAKDTAAGLRTTYG